MDATLAVVILTLARFVIPVSLALLVGTWINKQLMAVGGD